jgi:tetratricopeptide (TPR) repeat protein
MLAAAPLVLATLLAPLCARGQKTLAEIDVLWAAGERLAAVEALERLVAEHPADDALRVALVRRALSIHRYALVVEQSEGRVAELAAERGYALFRVGRFEEALDYLDPTRPDQVLYVVDTLESLGRATEAQHALEAAERVLGAGDPRLCVRRGRLAVLANAFPDAERHFRAALELEASDAEAWFGLGQALLRLGRRDEARAALERHQALVPLRDALQFAEQSLDLAPNHAPNHAQLGDAERALGWLDRAESSYRRALALAKDTEVTPIALRHARLCEEDRGDVDGALALLAGAFQRVPDVRLLVRQADLERRRGNDAASAGLLRKALALRPGDPEIEKRLAALSRESPGGRQP